MNDILQTIRSLYLFNALSDQQFNELTERSHTVSLQKDEALFNIEDDASSFYVLLSGKLKLSLNSPAGTEKILMIVRSMDLFAEAVMFREKPRYPVNAVALQATDILCFDNKLFVSYLRNSPDLSLKMLSLLSARLHKQINEIKNLSSQNSTSRVLNYLNTLVTDEHLDHTNITLDTSKKDLASRLSITPETLSRTLHKASKDQIIEIDGRHINIPSMSAFKHYLINN